MKHSLFLSLLVILSSFVFAQESNRVYYNTKWEITSKKHAAYYRISGFDAQKATFDGVTTDFYINGKPEMKGDYKNGKKNGPFVYYYPDGQVSLKSVYTNNNRTGTWIKYYRDGVIRKKVRYEGNREILEAYNDSMGNSLLKNNSCRFHLNYESNSYFDSNKSLGVFGGTDSYEMAGKIINGLKEGNWVVKKNGSLYSKIKYEDGIFEKGFLLLYDSKLPIMNDEMTRLIEEPEKLKVTEGLFLEQGQMIRSNYVLAALQSKGEEEQAKEELKNRDALINYFNSHFSKYVTDCNDTIRFSVKVETDKDGEIKSFYVSPRVPLVYREEVGRVLSQIGHLNQMTNQEINFDYRVLCVDELDVRN